jgi:hypothetical protein
MSARPSLSERARTRSGGRSQREFEPQRHGDTEHRNPTNSDLDPLLWTDILKEARAFFAKQSD